MNGTNTYGDQSIPESYVDNLELLELVDNKLYKLAGTVNPKGPEHFWLQDAVRASKTPVDAAQPEGRQFVGQRGTTPKRAWNTAQLFMEDIQVTGTAQRTEHIAIEDLFAQEAMKQEKAVAKDIERAILYGSRVQGAADGSGNETTERQMGGIKFLIGRDKATHAIDADAANGVDPAPVLDEDLFTSYIELSWKDGDRDGDLDVFTSAKQKKAISLFTTPNQRTIEAKSKMVVLPVDTIATDFGTANVHLHREMAAGDLLALDTSTLFKAPLLAPTTERYGKRGDSEDGAVKAELTLELRRPENSVFVSNLG